MHFFLRLNRAVQLPARARTALSRASRTATAASLFLCVVLGLAAQVAKARPAPPAQDLSRFSAPPHSSFTFADFDGDRQPDLATAEIEHSDPHFTRYLIRLHLKSSGGGTGQSIAVTGSFGLPLISALDVNGDHIPDLVLTAAGQARPIAVLLNDGRGRFSPANLSSFPSSFVGCLGRLGAATGHLQDIAVLVPAPTPQLEAVKPRQFFVPQPLAATSVFTTYGIAPDWPRFASPGRAPPASL